MPAGNIEVQQHLHYGPFRMSTEPSSRCSSVDPVQRSIRDERELAVRDLAPIRMDRSTNAA